MTALWVVCALLVLLERFSALLITAFAHGFTEIVMRRLMCEAVSALPEVMFLLGLWWVREALSAFIGGELFGPPVTRMLERVGVMLAIGALIRICVVPGACRLLGLNPGYWIAFDASAIVLGAMGIAFKVIANVLRRASAIESELDEIF